MNQRIEKMAEEIARTERKIADATNRLRDLRDRKTALENDEIVARVRVAAAEEGADIDAVLDRLMPSGAGAAPAAPGKRGRKGAADGEDDS